MPPLSPLMDFLANCLLEAGPITQTEWGARAISWAEFEAWQTMTQTELTTAEAIDIMSASQAYAAAINEYSNNSVNAPYEPVLSSEDQAERDAAAVAATEAEFDRRFQIGAA